MWFHEENFPSWQDEFRQALRSTKDLASFLDIPQENVQTGYPLFIPLHLAQRIKQLGPASALWKQFVPHPDEDHSLGYEDPIGDQVNFKGPQLIHRYHSRVLFMPTTHCPVDCRYCFRKNELAQKLDLFRPNFDETIEYLKQHPEVNEVILSGGDPLVLSDEKLLGLIEALAQVPSVRFLRFHSRVPVIIPSRINASFMRLLQKAQNLFDKVILVIHCNHLDELSLEVESTIGHLRQSGVELLSQSVLLKDVNDDVVSLKNLFLRLNQIGVRPYYLHHPDQAKGAMHFYLPLARGLELVKELRQQLSGWMLPQYILDGPDGQGKSDPFFH